MRYLLFLARVLKLLLVVPPAGICTQPCDDDEEEFDVRVYLYAPVSVPPLL